MDESIPNMPPTGESSEKVSEIEQTRLEIKQVLGVEPFVENVNVLRKSSGNMDDDWRVLGYDKENSIVVVANEAGQSKRVSVEDFKSWNPK